MVHTVGMIFDPHIVHGGRRDHDGVAVARRGIEKLNEVGVDWTLLGGDLRSFVAPAEADRDGIVDWGGWDGDPENKYYRKDYPKAKALFDDELESEYQVIRGNNDRPVDVFREHFPADEHPPWFHVTEDEVRYVFLDSNPDPGYHLFEERQNFVSAPQLSMLDRLMDEDPEIPTFVFCHAPLAKHPEFGPDWDVGKESAYYVTTNLPSVQSRLERGNTVIVNTGHYFRGEGRGAVTVNGIEYVNARHLVQGSDPDYGGDVRWMRVDPAAQEATVRYYDVGASETGELVTATW